MSKLRVHGIAISIDGFVAGPDQSLERPMGEGGRGLHEWVFETPFGREMLGQAAGDDGDESDGGVDDEVLRAGVEGIGATIMGRNMFGPIRGEWPDDSWTGWWGEEPPYHHPVFVLTHHARDPLPMAGGTTFHFVTDGIESALAQAVEAAGGDDVRIGGGADTIRQYLRAGLVDELHLAVSPVLLGSGERLFEGVDLVDSYECDRVLSSPSSVTHVRLVARRG